MTDKNELLREMFSAEELKVMDSVQFALLANPAALEKEAEVVE